MKNLPKLLILFVLFMLSGCSKLYPAGHEGAKKTPVKQEIKAENKPELRPENKLENKLENKPEPKPENKAKIKPNQPQVPVEKEQIEVEDVIPNIDSKDLAALFTLIKNNDLEGVKSYITKNPTHLHSISIPTNTMLDPYQSSPLLFSLYMGKPEISLYLLKQGANPLEKNNIGHSGVQLLYTMQGIDNDQKRELVKDIFNHMKRKKGFLAELKREVKESGNVLDFALEYQAHPAKTFESYLELLKPFKIQSTSKCGMVHSIISTFSGPHEHAQLALDILEKEFPHEFKNEALQFPRGCAKDVLMHIATERTDYDTFKFFLNHGLGVPEDSYCYLIKNVIHLKKPEYQAGADKIFAELIKNPHANADYKCAFGKSFKTRLDELTSGDLATGTYKDVQELFNNWKQAFIKPEK